MRFYVIAALSFGLAATVASAQSGAYWDYYGKTGPLAWGRLDPAYQACAKGHGQSPIDIRGARLNKALQPIEFHYVAGPVKIENDRRMIIVHVDPGSYIVAGGLRYDLKQFEFHHPSEEAVRGKLTDLGVELIHQGADGKMAIVDIRLAMDRDKPNAVLAMLLPHLPKKPGTTQQVSEMVNAGGFLPADRGYWTYMGSLTTPPCTEGVRWFVFEEEISLNLEQLRAFDMLFRMNSRPLQDVHGRRIEANE
ncbi:MAG: carbonic anhydrase family protein [Terracidiphilus sp.]